MELLFNKATVETFTKEIEILRIYNITPVKDKEGKLLPKVGMATAEGDIYAFESTIKYRPLSGRGKAIVTYSKATPYTNREGVRVENATKILSVEFELNEDRKVAYEKAMVAKELGLVVTL